MSMYFFSTSSFIIINHLSKQNLLLRFLFIYQIKKKLVINKIPVFKH